MESNYALLLTLDRLPAGGRRALVLAFFPQGPAGRDEVLLARRDGRRVSADGCDGCHRRSTSGDSAGFAVG